MLNHDGTVMNGWPVSYDADWAVDPNDRGSSIRSAKVYARQLVPGGDKEIIICEQKLRVRDISGQPIVSRPEIDLQGHCGGVALQDVNGDGTQEYVVLVNRTRRDVPITFRRGSFIEAYEMNGTRLADTDNRWPIVVPVMSWLLPQDLQFNSSVTLGDVDGNGDTEVVFVSGGPYTLSYWPERYTLVDVLDLQ